MTRAAARANQGDLGDATTELLPSTPNKIRKPLQEVTGNAIHDIQHHDLENSEVNYLESKAKPAREIPDIDSLRSRETPTHPVYSGILDITQNNLGSTANNKTDDVIRKESECGV